MKSYLSVLLLFFSGFCLAQGNFAWKGYFSYNDIKDLSQSPTTFYAAAENALFSQNLSSGMLKTTNTVDGLAGQTITAMYHSATFNRTLVGYDNGLIIVINEADGSMLKVVDIINKQLPPNIKRINHFSEYEGVVYVSCDFGIVQYNLPTLDFGDTYFIGDNGAEIVVSQTAVFNGNIYAATNSGIRTAEASNPNLVDFSQWATLATGIWTGVQRVGNELMAVTNMGQVNRFNGTVFNPFSQYTDVVDFRQSESYLVITTPATVYVLNETLGAASQASNLLIEDTPVFSCAAVMGGTLYIGTAERGVFKTMLSSPSVFDNITPDGPSRNNMFAINKQFTNLWAVYGAYTIDFDVNPLRSYGVSRLNPDSGWLNIPYSEVHEPGKEANNLVSITVDPDDEQHVFISSYHSGLLEFQNDGLIKQHDETNSGLESVFVPANPTYRSVRVGQTAFDRNKNLWVPVSLLQEPLKVLQPDNNWNSYSLNILSNSARRRFGKMVIDKNNTKWITSYRDGLLAFNEEGNISKRITEGTSGNLPSDIVTAVAIDNRDQVWIGTYRGLRVLSSVDRFQSDGQMQTSAIIILEDGLAQELLYQQYVTDIRVDGANNKWIGTADSGVFLVSSNGQETIYRFTTTNSPLPSNTINDIEIDGNTGEVFFATDKGLISFKGIATDPSDNLNNVVVYPNPVRPGYAGTVKITGLIDNANIKIADIEGNLVYETISQGGTIEWDTTAFGKYRVASGVYMIFISSDDGSETKVKKVMVVR
jgi:hypothetical protein